MKKCNWWNQHDWSDWEIIEEGKFESGSLLGSRYGDYIIQERRCKKCGFIKREVQEL